MTPKPSGEVDAGADGFEEKKSVRRLVMEGGLAEADAEDAAPGAGADEEPKIRSVEQPADRPANASTASATA